MKIRNLENNQITDWTIEEMLIEINRDRSESWTNYNESDYLEGWDEWVEGEFYTRNI